MFGGRPADLGWVRMMMAAQRHRGPDAEGVFDGGWAALGHNRLSIIDLSHAADQPMVRDGLVLVYNGEIYNFTELRAELEAKGHVFHTRSDTEVLLVGWREYGRALLPRLNGMFAFAVLDQKRRCLTLVRDRVGVKPLLFAQGRDWLAFASDLRSLLALPADELPRSLDVDAVRQVLDFWALPRQDRTPVASVQRLEAGSLMQIDADGRRVVERWWDLAAVQPVSIGAAEATDRISELLADSVRRQMVADCPVAISLSGGLDSSLVAALASSLTQGEVRTYSVAYGHARDERTQSASVAAHLRTRHTQIDVSLPDLAREFSAVVEACDDLTWMDGSAFIYWNVARQLHRDGCKVLLVGDGADEAFLGYSQFGLALPPFQWMPRRLRAALAVGLWNGRLDPLRGPAPATLEGDWAQWAKRPPMDRLALYEIARRLGPLGLSKADRMTMAWSIEGRVPYWDHRLIELAFSLPREYKFPGRWYLPGRTEGKAILRRIAAGRLPQAIAERQKTAFPLPYRDLAHACEADWRALLGAAGSLPLALYGARRIDSWFAQNRAGKAGAAWILYKLAVLETWRRSMGLSC
jgi:asparagine synthase (glutamine-hydrolysing)